MFAFRDPGMDGLDLLAGNGLVAEGVFHLVDAVLLRYEPRSLIEVAR